MLQEAKPTYDDRELKNKNKDALGLLDKMFGGGPKKDPPQAKGEERGRAEGGSAGGGVHENPELKKMKAREQALPTPNEALQGLIAGWSGAGWWQPCDEVCMPRKGTKRDKANFLKFQSCEQLCRKSKAESLRKVMSKIKTVAENAPPPKPVAPHTIQKLSKHLLKWAESQGLPAKLAKDANTNLKDNEQVGQSISGMLIAGWSGAGWWKPCGEVCAPSPGEKRTKANFEKFMACEHSCRRGKGEYLRAFLSPKEVVKQMAHA